MLILNLGRSCHKALDLACAPRGAMWDLSEGGRRQEKETKQVSSWE